MCGRCNSRNIIYQECISPMEHNNDGERVNISFSDGNRKQRMYNLRHSFSNPRLRNQTALSKYFLSCRDQELTPQIKWKIVWQSSTVINFNDRCNLYVAEKISIINYKGHRLLLKKPNEHVFKCKHKSKFKLSWLGDTDALTLDKNKDIDFRWFLLKIITIISVITSIMWRGVYVGKEILGTLDINSLV